MRNLILSIFAVTSIVACTSITSTTKVGTAQPSLTGTSWELADTVNTETPTLVIEEGKIVGNAGCNNFFANDFVTNASLGEFSASTIGSTRKACANMSVENNYLSMLKQVNKYIVRGTTLELYKDNLLLLKYNKKP